MKNILVIDWSNLMFRSLFMHKLFSAGTNTGTYDRIEDLMSFTNRFAVDVCAIINMFKPDHIIIASDSQHAWRKDILPGEDGYKGNRTKDPNVNWDNIYKCSNDLLNIMQKSGIDVAHTERAEADDIMALVKETAFSKFPDCNIIIVSADEDIRQLIEFNKDTKQFCVVYNTTGKVKSGKRRMYVTQEFKDWIDAPEVCDIFFSSYDGKKTYMRDLLNNNPVIEVCVDDPNKVLLNKVLCGDDGDNVPAFYSFYKDIRLVRVTPTRAQKLLLLTNSNTVDELSSHVHMIPEALTTIFKFEETVNDINCVERLQRQRLLVELKSNLFPENIRSYKDTIEYMLNNMPVDMTFKQYKAQELLKNTEYEGWDKRRALEADVFRDFEKLSGGISRQKPVNTINNDLTKDVSFSSNSNGLFNIDALF